MSRAAIAALGVFLGGLCATAAEGSAFTVGTATATEGHAATGSIDVPAGVDPALHIPVALFHGAHAPPWQRFAQSNI